jgi:nitrate/nitrite transport system ATP-binding protein
MSPADGVFFELRGVSKSYGDTPVLAGVDLELRRGEFLAIVGFSGSGKTTLISLMAGLIAPDKGEIRLEGELVRGPGPDRGVVFQNYSLLPWLSVLGNVELAVRHVFRSWPPSRRRERALHYIELVNLTAARHKRPAELSGGMRQRVSVARALAIDPKILLLDEPLSALDALTRATLQQEIERIWRQDRKTVVLITNDVDEAILLADRIVPLRPRPGAGFGPDFAVPLARPRDRRAVNHDPTFVRLRNEVTQYLVREGRAAQPRSQMLGLNLPDLEPADLRPPRASSLVR